MAAKWEAYKAIMLRGELQRLTKELIAAALPAESEAANRTCELTTSSNPIYLDYNATTPIDPVVAEAMLPFIHEHFGNPSSTHAFGVMANRAVAKARRQMAGMMHCEPDEIVFTGGGSESNNHAIKGVAQALRGKGDHIITSTVEHPAVTNVCRALEQQGFTVTWLPVDDTGVVDPADVQAAITPRTILVSVMHANNEVGTIQPIAEIAAITRAHDVLFHSDCAQSIGKIPVQVDELHVDLLSLAGHKIYAPKGIGALYIRRGVNLDKLIEGADHEGGRRAGTENVIHIAGLGAACEQIAQHHSEHHDHLEALRDRLETQITGACTDVRINGHPQRRLPNTSSIAFRGLEANTILAELAGVAASAGAACHSDSIDISSVLEAMRTPLEYAMGTIRLSVGRFTTTQEIDEAAAAIINVVGRLQPRETVGDVPDDGEIKLTRYTHGLGCACKLPPQLLSEVLATMPATTDANVLIDGATADDAAVYRIDDHLAIVQTVDFFTPIVDDPCQFGAIAAANSLSDIYAMGARPIFAVSVVGFPSNRLPLEVLKKILHGAGVKAAEAGISIVGGHTIDDPEPKFGMAVTGVVAPQKMITNSGCRPGDVLVLTKPVGTGILTTALKRGLLEPAHQEVLEQSMATLNDAAAAAMQAVGVNSCTDVSGFGLLGHLLEMMNGSDTAAVIEANAVPLLPGALDAAAAGIIPGGTRNNETHTGGSVKYDASIPDTLRALLNDAQTSGGLLISLPADRENAMIEKLRETGVEAARTIGEVIPHRGTRITVSPAPR